MTLRHIFLLAALPLAACSGPSEDGNASNAVATNEAMSNDAAADAGANETAPAPVAKTPTQTFVDTVAAINSYEIAAGKLGQEKATTPALKKYAKMLSDDHGQWTMKLKMAAAKVPGLMPNPSLTEEQRANIETLQSASGKAFDQAFVSQQLASHPTMVSEMNVYAASGEEEPLRDFAKVYGPWVLRHLRLAKEL